MCRGEEGSRAADRSEAERNKSDLPDGRGCATESRGDSIGAPIRANRNAGAPSSMNGNRQVGEIAEKPIAGQRVLVRCETNSYRAGRDLSPGFNLGKSVGNWIELELGLLEREREREDPLPLPSVNYSTEKLDINRGARPQRERNVESRIEDLTSNDSHGSPCQPHARWSHARWMARHTHRIPSYLHPPVVIIILGGLARNIPPIHHARFHTNRPS